MQFFVDTAEVADIKKLHEMGLLDGVTTNPSLIAKSGRQFKEVIKEICALVPGPVSAEVAATNYDGMIAEGRVLAKLADNVVVKVPLTVDGLRATKTFTNEGIKTNVTLCFSPNQALLAAKCGATYVSPFLGRLDDIHVDGTELIAEHSGMFSLLGLPGPTVEKLKTVDAVYMINDSRINVAGIPEDRIDELADYLIAAAG